MGVNALKGMVAGDFLNTKDASFEEFTKATTALLPVYAGCVACHIYRRHEKFATPHKAA